MEILKIENLKRTYGEGKTRVEALKNVNLSIDRGQMVAIMGPSGCGKSTLLNLISGIDKPTSGEIIVEDRNISKLNGLERGLRPQRRALGFLQRRQDGARLAPVQAGQRGR